MCLSVHPWHLCEHYVENAEGFSLHWAQKSTRIHDFGGHWSKVGVLWPNINHSCNISRTLWIFFKILLDVEFRGQRSLSLRPHGGHTHEHENWSVLLSISLTYFSFGVLFLSTFLWPGFLWAHYLENVLKDCSQIWSKPKIVLENELLKLRRSKFTWHCEITMTF